MKNPLLALSLLTCLFLTACGGGGPAGQYTLDADKFLADNPAFTKAMTMMAPKEKKDEILAQMKKEMKGTLEIKADNTFTMTMKQKGDDNVTSGTWKMEGENITFTRNKDDKSKGPASMTGTLKGKQLTVSAKQGPVEMKMTLNKS